MSAITLSDLMALRNVVSRATDVADVWQIRMPLMPWKLEGALRERASLISKLEASFSHRAMWLSDWTSDEHQGWRILRHDEQLSSWEDDLKSGAWALFFFEDRPTSDKLLELVPSEPPNATAAIQSVRKMGASAAIWSWYDNCEWLVVLPAAR